MSIIRKAENTLFIGEFAEQCSFNSIDKYIYYVENVFHTGKMLLLRERSMKNGKADSCYCGQTERRQINVI